MVVARRHSVVVIVCSLALSCCVRQDSSPVGQQNSVPSIGILDDARLAEAKLTWRNQTGLDSSTAVWQQRIESACSEGVWDTQVAVRLADDFLTIDSEGLGWSEIDIETAAKGAANTIWVFALQSCHSEFPGEAVETGPPFKGS